MLVGAYYPWLDHQWGGYVTSVPIKNPEITDTFSQIYIWKKLVIDSIKSLKLPFWNQYSLSGYPLLANFQSAFLNPLNSLMIIFGPVYGWGLMVYSQFFLASITMFLFLKKVYKNSFSALAGAITYAYSGFMFAWSQFATAGFAMIWLPLIFLNIFEYFRNKKIKNLLYLSPLYFLLMTSGHFQALIYGLIFSGFYFLYKFFSQSQKNSKTLIFFSLSSLLGILFMAIQLLPTLELSTLSVRFSENYISQFNYGLLSLDRLITLFAPDYFGNPNTMNFWGSFNYFETIIYAGVISIMALIFSLFTYHRLKDEKFFVIGSIITLLFSFNTFIGKSVYLLNLPGISTSAAGRINLLFVFCTSVLVAYLFCAINYHHLKNTLRYYWGYLVFVSIVTVFTLFMYKFSSIYPDLQQKYNVSLRNLAIPISISGLTLFILAFVKLQKLKQILIIFIIIFDLFRFGWKYTPFVNQQYFYPQTEIIQFLTDQKGLFRIEKEKGPLLTPNVWTAYGLSSTSGYDPLGLDSYSRFYKEYLNGEKNITHTSRYYEIDNYSSQNLGEANIKYLLALNYDPKDKISPQGDHLYYKINTKEWQKVYKYGSIIVLENSRFKPRIEINNIKDQKTLSNIRYSANEISFNINSSQDNQNIILRDTWYPGWKAFIDDQPIKIDKYLGIYRIIRVDKGEHFIKFIYQPETFWAGSKISFISLIIWLILLIRYRKKYA